MKKVKSILEALKKTEQDTGKTILDIVTINDLRDKEDDGTIQPEEKRALRNYEVYRIKKLNKVKNEEEFHEEYKILQALANLSPYEEFLNEKYAIQ